MSTKSKNNRNKSKKNNQQDDNPFKNNPHSKMININGEDVVLIDMVSMSKEQELFYDIILKTMNLWSYEDPAHHFFIGNNKICGLAESINFLRQDPLLSVAFKNNHLRIIKIKNDDYNNYGKLIESTQSNNEYYQKMSCIQIMKIMKNIGNDIYAAGGLKNAAHQLYIGGITRLGQDQDAKHEKCVKDEEHDEIVSKLYNNLSVIHFTANEYDLSAKYAEKALRWNPNYVKCKRRLKEINNIMYSVD